MYFSINELSLIISLEASTGIEPVYTDLQSAASPLRQLAAWCGIKRYTNERYVVQDET